MLQKLFFFRNTKDIDFILRIANLDSKLAFQMLQNEVRISLQEGLKFEFAAVIFREGVLKC